MLTSNYSVLDYRYVFTRISVYTHTTTAIAATAVQRIPTTTVTVTLYTH